MAKTRSEKAKQHPQKKKKNNKQKSLTEHDEKVKQAQALTAIYNSKAKLCID